MSDLTTNKARLFALMRDGQWHHMREMEIFGGMRYGARLWEIVRDCAVCGEALHNHAEFAGETWCPSPHPFAIFQARWRYEKETTGENEWRYRLIEIVGGPVQLALEV